MVDEKGTPGTESGKSDEPDTSEAKARRKIPGNLTYITNFGSIKSVLDKIETASTPDKFSQDYLATVLKLSGGSYRAVVPVLKRVGFLTSDGTPTALYAKFRTGSGRPEAVYMALKNGFAELFRRNEHVYAASDAKLTDLIVETTGLAKDETVVGAIRGTFRVFSSYLPSGFTSADVGTASQEPADVDPEVARPNPNGQASTSPPLGLAYNINIVLPESRDIEVFNVIFRSLRDNLLRS